MTLVSRGSVVCFCFMTKEQLKPTVLIYFHRVVRGLARPRAWVKPTRRGEGGGDGETIAASW